MNLLVKDKCLLYNLHYLDIYVKNRRDNMKDIMSIKKRLEQKSAINGKAGVAIMSDMLNEEKIRNLVIKHYNSNTCENESRKRRE